MELEIRSANVTASHDTVHIVRIALDTVPLDLSALSADERERASRFVFDRDRRRFVAAHSAMRSVLAKCLDSAPAAIRFERGLYGKPKLADAGIDVRFNLSHAGERGLLALTIGRDIGIDIEQQLPIDVMSMAHSVFSPLERAALLAIEPHKRLEAFYRGWTRKESFLKARGDGLFFPLNSFDVSLEESPSQLLLECRPQPDEVTRWRMIDLNAQQGYSATVTIERGHGQLVDWKTVEAFTSWR